VLRSKELPVVFSVFKYIQSKIQRKCKNEIMSKTAEDICISRASFYVEQIISHNLCSYKMMAVTNGLCSSKT
jgi:hypothetical protein